MVIAITEAVNFQAEKLVTTTNTNNPMISQKQDSTISLNKPQSESTEGLDYAQKVHQGFLKIKRKLLKIEDQNNHSEKTLDRVLLWTGGQSFLTQKLFALLAENPNKLNYQQEEQQIDGLVQTKILHDWENNELRLHLSTIKERLLNNPQCQSDKLLLLYQKILTETVSVDQSQEQQELLNMGLVVRLQNKLIVANRIYQSVFNLNWVTTALNRQIQSNNLRVVPGKNPNESAMLSKSPAEAKKNWFKFNNILLLLTLIGLMTIFFNNIAKGIEIRLAFKTGNKLLKQKSFTEAIVKYNRLLNIDSNYFQAWTNRGYALAGLQKYEEMGESCSTATIIEPTAVYAWNCRGEALHNLQRYPEAIAAFEKAIALDRTDPIFLINKSESLRAMGRNEASITSLKEAIQLLEQIEASQSQKSISGEFAVALTLLGNGYRQQEQYQDAVAAYQRAIEYSTDYFPAHLGKGIALNKLGRFQEAQRELKGMLSNPQLTEVQQSQTWFHLGKALCHSEQYSLGMAAFEQAIELKPNYTIAEDAKKHCR